MSFHENLSKWRKVEQLEFCPWRSWKSIHKFSFILIVGKTFLSSQIQDLLFGKYPSVIFIQNIKEHDNIYINTQGNDLVPLGYSTRSTMTIKLLGLGS